MNAKKLQKVLDTSDQKQYSFYPLFCDMVKNNSSGYETPESFLEDMQNGCASGMISEMIYHASCRDIYTAHFEDLNEYKQELEENTGMAIENRYSNPYHTFICWLCFEEFCYELYSENFDK